MQPRRLQPPFACGARVVCRRPHLHLHSAAAASSWLSGAAPAIVSVVGPGRRWLWLGLGYGKLLAAAAAAAAASSWLSGAAPATASVGRSNARAG